MHFLEFDNIDNFTGIYIFVINMIVSTCFCTCLLKHIYNHHQCLSCEFLMKNNSHSKLELCKFHHRILSEAESPGLNSLLHDCVVQTSGVLYMCTMLFSNPQEAS